MIAFGPIPSRRLGQSIGINNIPPKTCSYSCIYCQIGRTNHMQVNRACFYTPEDIRNAVEAKLTQLAAENRRPDYLSFVPDGEPTLDINLGKTIRLLKPFGIKIAVITNASLLWMDDVRKDLMNADWVSVSIDAADENTWRKMDRPHGALRHADIKNGIIDFARVFKGTLVTETMLAEGINDSDACVEKIAELIAALNPKKSYLLVPTRPPAESAVKRPSPERIKSAAASIGAVSGTDVECITGNENAEGFFFTDDIAGDILSIASVHPIREDILRTLFEKRNADKSVLEALLDRGELIRFSHEGQTFYRKKITDRNK